MAGFGWLARISVGFLDRSGLDLALEFGWISASDFHSLGFWLGSGWIWLDFGWIWFGSGWIWA